MKQRSILVTLLLCVLLLTGCGTAAPAPVSYTHLTLPTT